MARLRWSRKIRSKRTTGICSLSVTCTTHRTATMISHQEEELESAIWGAIQRFKCTCPDANLFVDAVIVAARHYAAGDSEELTAMRRRILAREAAEEQTSP